MSLEWKKKWIFCYFRWQSDCKLIGELFLNTLNLILNCIQLYVPVPDLLIVYLNENSLSRLFFLSPSRWLPLFFDDCGAVIGRFQVKVEPTFFPLFVIIVSSYSLLWCLSTIILQLCDTINGLHYYIYINSFQRIFFFVVVISFSISRESVCYVYSVIMANVENYSWRMCFGKWHILIHNFKLYVREIVVSLCFSVCVVYVIWHLRKVNKISSDDIFMFGAELNINIGKWKM